MAENALHRADPSEPVFVRENPAVKAGLIRVYGVVNLYLTFGEDIERMYLLGIQATST